jgi:hypothetical protein
MLFFYNESFTWVDNTPNIWDLVRDTLHARNPTTVQVNLDSEVVFGGGMHAGELSKVVEALDVEWFLKRVKSVPMLGVEYVARRVEGQLEWYRKLQETAWAMVSEAFSEKVITPGITTTHVRI